MGDRIADWVAKFVGSWTYVIIQTVLVLGWIIINSLFAISWLNCPLCFDPFPYILLNLVFSFLAGYQAPLILMSQNRQAERDRKADDVAFQVLQRVEEIQKKILHEVMEDEDNNRV